MHKLAVAAETNKINAKESSEKDFGGHSEFFQAVKCAMKCLHVLITHNIPHTTIFEPLIEFCIDELHSPVLAPLNKVKNASYRSYQAVNELLEAMTTEKEEEILNGASRFCWLPSKQQVYLQISHLAIVLFIICILYSVLDKDVLPGSEIFALLLLYVLAFIGGKIVYCTRLPPLLGMLIAGFLYRNIPFLHFYKDMTLRWTSALRGAALAVILLKAGLGLDARKLKQLKSIVLRLAFLPCLIETLTVSVTCHFLLQLPWTWAILLGFVLSAVSPAVVVPSLLSLQEKQYGTKKGVPTLVVAAASLDDILAITGFTIMLSITLSGGSWLWSLAKGLLEPFAGFIFGIMCGRIFWYIPSQKTEELSLCAYRVTLLCCGGLAILFMSKKLDVAGAGPFGCLVLGFVTSFHWKQDSATFARIEKSISFLWQLLQPFLFGLIGCEVTISSLEENIGSSLAVLSVGLLFRTVTALVVTFGGGFNLKERVFVAFAWLPKATVQAAIGPQALDYVLANEKGEKMEEYAKTVLSIAVLSILLTAPVGAIFIALLGPVLLSNDKEEQVPTEICDEDQEHSQVKTILL